MTPVPDPGPACAGRDPAIWFPAHETGGAYDQARVICGGCPVRGRCLTDVMAWERGKTGSARFGMFAGLKPSERARLHQTGKMPDEKPVRVVPPRRPAMTRLPNACRECGRRIAAHRVRCTTCAFVILNG